MNGIYGAPGFGAPERKFHATGTLEVRGGVIEGYASVFGRRDQGGDMVLPGAYGASLAALGGRRVKMLWQHDAGEPIGVWEDVREDGTGLYVRGRILPEVARGREAIALLDAGAIDGLSIGYRTVRAERDAKGRQLAELDLWEVSLVTFPMQIEARVQGKSEDLGGWRSIAAALRGATAELAAAR
ncbi:HK97 family phage prohead protease [Falsirhodobacter halotolerans]|uniref:HK97 family phage prohead protease n=1 Tax=Falsirhodobacter halotolerans TaxID=1146892 RepID=UPI001FD5207E|nr:HK97 family phage prohead protease [Falsirhodobacter halotolerans]MCJ8139296.1 HK97 family phage prohead protease [Falsirhodobacter halotolerans]